MRSRRRGSMLGLGSVAKPYRKLFVPAGMDRWDGRTLAGVPIKPGTVVKVTAHYGPFRVIEVRGDDGDLISEMSVGRGSLVPVPKNLEEMKRKADREARLRSYWFVVVLYDDGVLQVLHKDDADAVLGQQPLIFTVIYEAKPFGFEQEEKQR